MPILLYTRLSKRPSQCSVTGTTFDAVPAPSAIILVVSLPMYHGRQLMYLSICISSSVPQLRATSRAVSGRSVPIIAFGAAGPGAYIGFFLVRNAWEVSEILVVQKLVARTGLSDDEIGPKVHISYHASRRTKRSCI